ncbi:integrase [Pseudomonas sp. 21LCFQ010]|uniref:integrase n=1 Tax=Pseudomonas sp. 21LCFQ010 TaxID=2957506 RepID=UPI0020976418|nr:integrase [Pseudomonas sp. 21LCFQ010]MCO8165222.1 integrase [Pseudomonas sp. 21LCFQ010]
MSNIILFVPKDQLDARRNLASFVDICKNQLTVFGADLDWDRNGWPGVGNFTKKGAPSRGYKAEQLLHPSIMDFAKSYVRYQQGLKPSKLKNEFKAIRCIEEALLSKKGIADITLVDPDVMDVAAAVAATYKATAYQAGLNLQGLVTFLNESRIISSPVNWVNPFSKEMEIGSTSVEGKQKRDEKMPPDGAIDAMAEMFYNDLQSPRDRFTTSIFALCLCAPSRISEVQDLPANCLHYETDSKGVNRVGLRFYAGKGYMSDIKWLPTVMNGVAEEAVRRLLELSEAGRAVARWYEENPEKFYRHAECPNVSEDYPLSSLQVCEAMGIKPGVNAATAVKSFFATYSPYKALTDQGGKLTLRFLNEYCRSKLPAGFPWKNKERHIRYSEALCGFRKHELRPDLTTSPVAVWTPGVNDFTLDINYRAGQERSIWQRQGYKNADGSPVHMVSHQIRHYLNTLANRGGLGQLDIAKWSGRKNIHQNSTYNHMHDDEYVEMARDVGVGGVLAKVKVNDPVTYADLGEIGEGIAHLTPYGFCVHNFAMLPCQKHRDCINCTEQVCIKGDKVKLERLILVRDGTRSQLAKAREADEQGVYGADRWAQHQIKTLERAEQLISILESPDTPDGTIVRLSNDQEFSPLKRAIAARSATPKLKAPTPPAQNDDEDLEMEELRDLMGI